MAKIIVLMADGCEEIEGLTVVDLLRRAGDDVKTVSLGEDKKVAGAHGIDFLADVTIDEIKEDEFDAIVLPGGAPGYMNLKLSEKVRDITVSFDKNKKIVAAICASPTVLGAFGLLKDKRATCYPGMENELFAKEFAEDKVVWDGNILTSRGVGTAIDFALAMIEHFHSKEAAGYMSKSIVYNN